MAWGMIAALAVCSAPRLAGQEAVSTVTPDPAGQYFLRLEPSCFLARESLLAELGRCARAGDRKGGETALAGLEAGVRDGYADVRRAVTAQGAEVVDALWIVSALVVRAGPDAASTLAATPGVVRVTPVQNRRPHLRTATSDVFARADQIQAQTRYAGRGCTVAVLDSGIARNVGGSGRPHRAFDPRTGTGTRLLGAYSVAPQGGTPPPPDDTDGHGTAVASIVLGADWHAPNSDHGFAPDARLVSYRLTDAAGLVSDATLTRAYQQVAIDRLRHDVRVLNCSLSGPPSPDAEPQTALDNLVLFSDVLVVTSAGNDGTLPQPGARSQANCNGLAVGSLLNEFRQVDPSSSYGPLPGDGGRFWPDLVAMGSLFAARFDDENASRWWTGTSFAAPQVTGTAAMLRGADPTLSAFDTKAYLLHGVEDVAAANPTYDRFRYGLGMLRTDLVFAAFERDILRRGAVSTTVPVQEFQFDLVQGQRYAATVVWPRLATDRLDWDNLDLMVYGPDQRLRVASETPRNLYEKVVFTAQQSGRHRFLVVGTGIVSPATTSVPFSFVFGDDRSGAVQPGSFLTLGPGCSGSGPSPNLGLIVPPSARLGWGNDATRVPFADAAVRFQQVLDHAWIGTGNQFALARLGLRRDGGEANTPNAQVDVEIKLGYSSRTAAAMVASFSGNADLGPLTQVRNGIIDLPGLNPRSESPGAFDHVIALDAPFQLATTPNRHLLLDVQVRGNSHGNSAYRSWFDAVTEVGAGRVYQFNGTPNVVFEPTSLVLSLLPDGPGYATPRLDPVGDARPGRSFSLVLRGGRASGFGVLVHGVSRDAWGGVQLPIDLASIGAPGCRLYTDWAWNRPVDVTGAGTCRIDYAVPALPALSGTLLHTQFLIVDPLANPFGLAVSSAGRIVVGG